ncbi:MAG: hypothetical protein QXG39_03455 [Candidatus Aenigmatarchaeota archaeon]
MKETNKSLQTLKELLIRKKRIELELNKIEEMIKNIVNDLKPGDYGDVKIVETSRLILDTSRLKSEIPDVYFKYLKEKTYKYATLNKTNKKGGKK